MVRKEDTRPAGKKVEVGMLDVGETGNSACTPSKRGSRREEKLPPRPRPVPAGPQRPFQLEASRSARFMIQW